MSTDTPRRLLRPLLAAAMLLEFAACSSVTPIAKLLNNPGEYNGKTVEVAGQVQQSLGGLGVGAYDMKDETGSITVLSDKGSPPPSGAKITVKGIFQSLITLGTRSLSVLREQSRSTS